MSQKNRRAAQEMVRMFREEIRRKEMADKSLQLCALDLNENNNDHSAMSSSGLSILRCSPLTAEADSTIPDYTEELLCPTCTTKSITGFCKHGARVGLARLDIPLSDELDYYTMTNRELNVPGTIDDALKSLTKYPTPDQSPQSHDMSTHGRYNNSQISDDDLASAGPSAWYRDQNGDWRCYKTHRLIDQRGRDTDPHRTFIYARRRQAKARYGGFQGRDLTEKKIRDVSFVGCSSQYRDSLNKKPSSNSDFLTVGELTPPGCLTPTPSESNYSPISAIDDSHMDVNSNDSILKIHDDISLD